MVILVIIIILIGLNISLNNEVRLGTKILLSILGIAIYAPITIVIIVFHFTIRYFLNERRNYKC